MFIEEFSPFGIPKTVEVCVAIGRGVLERDVTAMLKTSDRTATAGALYSDNSYSVSVIVILCIILGQAPNSKWICLLQRNLGTPEQKLGGFSHKSGCIEDDKLLNFCDYSCFLTTGVDYEALASNLTFSSMIDRMCRNITINDDMYSENNETIRVYLESDDSSVIIEQFAESEITIVDDDSELNDILYTKKSVLMLLLLLFCLLLLQLSLLVLKAMNMQ